MNKKFDTDGQPQVQMVLKDGVEIREEKYWHKNGQLKSHAFYRGEQFEGERKLWHANGQPELRSFYQNGKLEKRSREWYDNGNLLKDEFYRNGKREGECKLWYNDKKLCLEEFYRDGNRHGERKYWYVNGCLAEQEFYRDGCLEGKYKTWYENGQLMTQMFFKMEHQKENVKFGDIMGVSRRWNFIDAENWKESANLGIKTDIYFHIHIFDPGILFANLHWKRNALLCNCKDNSGFDILFELLIVMLSLI